MIQAPDTGTNYISDIDDRIAKRFLLRLEFIVLILVQSDGNGFEHHDIFVYFLARLFYYESNTSQVHYNYIFMNRLARFYTRDSLFSLPT